MDWQILSTGDVAARQALIEAARARIAAGDAKFTIKALCAQTGIERAVFQRCFAGKQALMAALIQPRAAAPAPTDAWLERRLRVFERALTNLETRTEAAARDHSIAIAQLKERLAADTAPVPQTAVAEIETVKASSDAAEPEKVQDTEPQAPAEPPVSRDEMAAFLETARRAAHEADKRRTEKLQARSSPLRRLTMAGLALLATLAICAVLTLGHASFARDQGAGLSHRHLVNGGWAQTMARADSGDADAQTQVALAYLRGDGVTQDDAAAARWAHAAARHGVPAAQYVLGSLYREGEGVTPDAEKSVYWFRQAALGGNIKAMHNLAIAFAEGKGVTADPALAAAWFGRAAALGYRDSEFDLAVLYERGLGVPQSLRDALSWYQTAAKAGDAPSAERVVILREQIGRQVAAR